jgi:hypothetical protein
MKLKESYKKVKREEMFKEFYNPEAILDDNLRKISKSFD